MTHRCPACKDEGYVRNIDGLLDACPACAAAAAAEWGASPEARALAPVRPRRPILRLPVKKRPSWRERVRNVIPFLRKAG